MSTSSFKSRNRKESNDYCETIIGVFIAFAFHDFIEK